MQACPIDIIGKDLINIMEGVMGEEDAEGFNTHVVPLRCSVIQIC